MIKNNNIFLFLPLLFFCVDVCATDFGDVQLRSNLGEAFKGSVSLKGIVPNLMVSSCFRSKIETIDGALLANPRIEFDRINGDKSTVQIKLSSRELIAEPAIKLTLELICDGYMQRIYPLLLDYVEIAAPVSGVPLADVLEEEAAQTAEPKTPLIKPVQVKPESEQANAAPRAKISGHHVRSVKPGSGSNRIVHKDALKISNEPVSIPVDAPGKPIMQPPQSLEQQRLAENNSAEEAFAKMMRNESDLIATREDLKKEQQRVQGLETELLRLKMDFQLKDQKPQTLPSLLIILNALVLMLFIVVVALLVVMLRRARRAEKQSWSAGSFERRSAQPDTRPDRSAMHQNDDEDEVLPDSPPPTTGITEIAHKQDTNHFQANLNQDQNLASANLAIPEEAKEKKPAAANAFNLFANREGQSIHIEEISDAMQEAEFWLSIKDPQRAIEILEPQSMTEHPTTPVMWLLLLDLYRMVENRDKYNQLRTRIKQKFNTNILAFSEAPKSDSIKFLCDYEHLTSKLTAFWNTNYILPFLESLLIDDREGERVGFELSVYQDILMLIAISKELEKPEASIQIAVD